MLTTRHVTADHYEFFTQSDCAGKVTRMLANDNFACEDWENVSALQRMMQFRRHLFWIPADMGRTPPAAGRSSEAIIARSVEKKNEDHKIKLARNTGRMCAGMVASIASSLPLHPTLLISLITSHLTPVRRYHGIHQLSGTQLRKLSRD